MLSLSHLSSTGHRLTASGSVSACKLGFLLSTSTRFLGSFSKTPLANRGGGGVAYGHINDKICDAIKKGAP